MSNRELMWLDILTNNKAFKNFVCLFHIVYLVLFFIGQMWQSADFFVRFVLQNEAGQA